MSIIFIIYTAFWASLVAQTVKNPPAMQEIWVQSLDQEDPPEKWMAALSSTLARRIPWTEEPGGLQPVGVTKSWTWLSDSAHTHTYCFLFLVLFDRKIG